MTLHNAITDVPGLRVGHAGGVDLLTGCTVILPPEGAVGGVDVRGPAPGSRETALLAPDKPVETVNAVLLTGGSAFGLSAADGVVRHLEEQGIGHWTPYARVPIVPAAVVYDLFIGKGKNKPDAQMGYQACLSAEAGPVEQGNVGAGTAVTVGKWGGFETMMKGGFGTASLALEVELGEPSKKFVVGAAAVTNCVGDVVAADGKVLAGARSEEGVWLAQTDPYRRFPDEPPMPPGTNTTLIVVATNARLTKVEANRLSQRAHDGLAQAIHPAHTTHDGDTAFALATGEVEVRFDLVANAAVLSVAEAIRSSVRSAATLEGIPGLMGE